MKYIVNITDIEKALFDLGGEARAKTIQDKVLEEYCDGEIPDNYQDAKSFRQTIQRKMEDYCPQAAGYNSLKKEGKFLRVGHGMYRIASGHNVMEVLFTEEITEPEKYTEGAIKKIAVNFYERSSEARRQCIQHYGVKCVICGFDFEKTYGEIGRLFIHVHHLVPLSEVKSSYVVDPIKDMRPVCANCHAVIHRTTPALSIEKLKEVFNQ
ncbi:HNH endonuclease [Deefgea piscis]|uniref:HNH endonuclease n=1 Tax=Deefgea piscis TaxID=2739061 RepID=A0A6M8SPG2_9NEIS|nr:HNH endonuclease [Deefgea piscis]QKJ66058.1 HNH endonuclease [Deefgea piscis]